MREKALDNRQLGEQDLGVSGAAVRNLSRQLRVLFVASAEAGERIRIISARKATPAQRKVYENGP